MDPVASNPRRHDLVDLGLGPPCEVEQRGTARGHTDAAVIYDSEVQCTDIEVLEPAGHPSGGSHTASASEPVSAANTRSGEALMTRTAVSVRLIAGAPVALVDHPRAEHPGLDQIQRDVLG